MRNTTKPSCLVLAMSIAAVTLPACARGAKTETARRAERTSGALSTKESLRTSVEAVDQAGRSVTLRDDHGRPFTIVAGDGAALERLQPNDPVRLVYQEAVAFQLRDDEDGENTAQPATLQRFETRQLPKGEGVEFRRRVDTVVEILAVAPEGNAATFRIPEGNVRHVEIEDIENRNKVRQLRPGDAVAVVYTEKLLLERD
jgi:hypothetical protein